jgi:hypothetical protein
MTHTFEIARMAVSGVFLWAKTADRIAKPFLLLPPAQSGQTKEDLPHSYAAEDLGDALGHAGRPGRA